MRNFVFILALLALAVAHGLQQSPLDMKAIGKMSVGDQLQKILHVVQGMHTAKFGPGGASADSAPAIAPAASHSPTSMTVTKDEEDKLQKMSIGDELNAIMGKVQTALVSKPGAVAWAPAAAAAAPAAAVPTTTADGKTVCAVCASAAAYKVQTQGATVCSACCHSYLGTASACDGCMKESCKSDGAAAPAAAVAAAPAAGNAVEEAFTQQKMDTAKLEKMSIGDELGALMGVVGGIKH